MVENDTLTSDADASCFFPQAATSFFIPPLPHFSFLLPLVYSPPFHLHTSKSESSLFCTPQSDSLFSHFFNDFVFILFWSIIYIFLRFFAIFCNFQFSACRTDLPTSASSYPIALWTPEKERIFIDLCVEFFTKSMSFGSFYASMIAAFNDELNLDWSNIQIKNKWNNLKRSWADCDKLLQVEGGIWDLENYYMDGLEEWWNTTVRRFKRFKLESPFEFREFDQLFGDCIKNETCIYLTPFTPPS